MKRTFAAMACLAVVCLVATPIAAVAGATAGSWTGWVTDAACGATGANAAHKACAEKCMEKGSKLVFFNSSDKKIYKLDKQDVAKQNIGHEVTVKGKVDGNTIAVDSIEPAAPAKTK
jgi:hypothetical protein